MISLQELQRWGENRLHCRTEVDILLGHCLGISRTQVYSRSDVYTTGEQQEKFKQWVERRVQGEPMAYLLGEKEFWSLPLKITNDVLIPRPETELIIELVLSDYGNKGNKPNRQDNIKMPDNLRILDLGTGSGAIALSLAKECPGWEIVATDNSVKALELAKHNANHLSISNIEFYLGDWFSALDPLAESKKRFDIIVSNPPYIASNDPHLVQGDLRFEPVTALVGGEEGDRDLKHIIETAATFLTSKGKLILEHGCTQGSGVATLLQDRGFVEIKTFKDLAHLDRVTVGSLP